MTKTKLNSSAANPDRLTLVYQLLIGLAEKEEAAESASLDSSTDSTAEAATLAEPAQPVKHTTAGQRGQTEVTR